MASNSNRRSGSSDRSGRDTRRFAGTGTGRASSHSGRSGASEHRTARSKTKKTIEINTSARVAAEKDRPSLPRGTARPSRTARTATAASDKRVRSTDASSQGRRVADAKARERQRRERERRRRARLRIAVVVVAVVLVAAAGMLLYRSTFLMVETVEVTGLSRLTRAEVVDLADIPDETTMLRVPRADIERRLLENPFVESVRVTRKLPSTIHIRIEERTPFVALEYPDAGTWLASRDMHWLAPASAEETATMLVVRSLPADTPEPGKRSTDPVVDNALEIVAGLSDELRAMTAVIDAPSIGKTELITREGVGIFLGSSEQLEVKDELARRILAENPGKVVYINVRVVDRPTWRGL